MIVVDASAVVDALTGTGLTKMRQRLSGSDLHAPALLDYECVAALRNMTFEG